MDWLNQAADPLQRATCADIGTWLPDDLLVKYDRMAMANSLEGRAPYLDPRVVDLGVRRLRPRDRMAGGVSKIALRRIATRWLPAEIVKRRKQGFVLPMRMWLRQWLDLHGGAKRYFEDRSVPHIAQERLGSLVDADVQRGIERERLIFALVLLAEWYESFLTRSGRLRGHYASIDASSGSCDLRMQERSRRDVV